jgi:beta-hydroxylase
MFIDQEKFIYKDLLLDNSHIFLEEYGNISSFFQYPEYQDDILLNNKKWYLFPFVFKNRWGRKKYNHPCKKSEALLRKLDHIFSAYYSIFEPGAEIYPHVGQSEDEPVYRVHLPLVVPKDSENCWLKVGGQKRLWENDKLLIFDDTIEHEARNYTEEKRIIVLMDFKKGAFV